jgi:excisionase family DNA binding protein
MSRTDAGGLCAADDARRRHRPRRHFLTIKVAAELADVSQRSVRRWIENGDLPVHRVAGVVRIADDDWAAFWARHRQS